jgi:hypothetical protein
VKRPEIYVVVKNQVTAPMMVSKIGVDGRRRNPGSRARILIL